MNQYFEILSLKETKSLEDVKKAYYKKIKKYPPESNEEMFILINEAYKKIIEYIKNHPIDRIENIDIYIDMLKAESKKIGPRNIKGYSNYLNKLINNDNFRYVSDKLIDMIITLNSEGYHSEALFITLSLKNRFREIGYIALADAYKSLEEHILNS